jgi:hypothetical protein
VLPPSALFTVDSFPLMGLHHPLDGITNPKYKLLHFLTTKMKFCKEKNTLAFNWDKCCHLVLCLWLISFHYLAFILWAWVLYCVKVNLKRPLHFINKALHPKYPLEVCKTFCEYGPRNKKMNMKKKSRKKDLIATSSRWREEGEEQVSTFLFSHLIVVYKTKLLPSDTL